jgi:hypothetical protein
MSERFGFLQDLEISTLALAHRFGSRMDRAMNLPPDHNQNDDNSENQHGNERGL